MSKTLNHTPPKAMQQDETLPASKPERGPDRRTRPTPIFSRYWLTGRRRGGRRAEEGRNIYVDRYDLRDYLLVGGVLLFSLLDMIYTLIHLNAGGTEANPVMAWTLDWGGDTAFKAVKVVTTLVGLSVLLLHVRFRRVRTLLALTLALYMGVFVFHLYLAHLRDAATLV